MLGKKKMIALLVIFIASIFILVDVVACSKQPKPLETVTPIKVISGTYYEPSPTETPLSTLSAIELENIFGNSSCSWPCWQGITPGITTSTEALQKINDSPLVIVNSIQVEGSMTDQGKAFWQWKLSHNEESVVSGMMKWKDGTILWINLNTDSIVPIGVIMNGFGEPQKIEVIDCTEIIEGPQWWCTTLYYATDGFEIDIEWERLGNEDVSITSNYPIKSVYLFEPSTIEDWLLSWGLNPTNRDFQDWKGYGNLLELYLP